MDDNGVISFVPVYKSLFEQHQEYDLKNATKSMNIEDISSDIYNERTGMVRVDHTAADFSKIGYEYLGEFGIKGRRYLRKGGDERTYQIHIFQAEDWNNIGRHLAFRDYMRTHKKERDEYAKIKKNLQGNFLMT
ncbi:GrpB family protein [Companilactobacillus zhachilii]|uniref:GrpB family protein n=1 Tax=Companilactobacillus zhachilii TaxID=2304606 RepID=UPI001980F0AD|nr:GrpB family protein [Companilactobacillus zhachilii]